jgi:hypothetical protein
MANFSGKDYTNAPIGVLTNGISSDVASGSQQLTTWAISVRPVPAALSGGVGHPVVSIVHHSLAGFYQELFGSQLFERIIILPRIEALGFVLSSTQFPVEVWNTFRMSEKILTAIVITGAGGVTLTDPYGEPLVYGALDSYIYQATMPSAGPAQINQDILFQFSPSIPGTDLLITGSRVTLFSVAPDWASGIKEKISYLTDVMRSYSDREQRRALRQIPRRGLHYRASAFTARNSAGMESLVWGWQHQPYGVPWWQDATPLTADIAAGSFSIPCDTTDRQFAAGGIATIWKDEYTFEALTVDAVFSDHITITSPTQLNWSAGAASLVMPVFLARLKNQVQVDRLWSAGDSMDLDFAGEASQPAPAPTVTLPQFKGFDVLEIMPNWISGLTRVYNRSVAILDPQVGKISAIDKGGAAIVAQSFPWWIQDHAAATNLRAFLIARFGQLRPFWSPTWDQDLVLHNDLGATDSGITIDSVFYTRFFFPSVARRFLAFIPTDGSGNVYRKITGSTDNGDGTETLVLESPTGKVFSKDQTQVSFLTLNRLASDDVEMLWSTSDFAQSALQFQEVPHEVPA